MEQNKKFVWVSPKVGHTFTQKDKLPINLNDKGFVCLGSTTDYFFPYTLSSGRIFYKPNSKSMRKHQKNRKKLF
jgi:hypothetical protein